VLLKADQREFQEREWLGRVRCSVCSLLVEQAPRILVPKDVGLNLTGPDRTGFDIESHPCQRTLIAVSSLSPSEWPLLFVFPVFVDSWRSFFLRKDLVASLSSGFLSPDPSGKRCKRRTTSNEISLDGIR
jgi:hypothetical protein